METRQLIICRGIQGSGKSTWAKQWCHEDPEHRIRFNNDDIRNMLGDYWVPNREKVVTATYNTVLAYGMEKGYNIVVDNMNLNPKTCAELEKTVKDFNENYTYDWKYEVEYKDFFIPVDECIRRDAMRPNPIGEKVIKATWRRYRDFIIQEDIKSMLKKSPKHVDGGRPVILVDMDATLCRYSYEVEAETLEEAVELVKDGDVDSTDMEEFFESDVFLTPQENGGQPTHEIYLAKDDTLLYSNGDK